MSTFGPYPATVLAVHDGDTLTVLADLGFQVFRRVEVRLAGCNAAELGTPGGQSAAAWLQGLLSPGAAIRIVSHGVDKYGGRADCSVILGDGRDVTGLGIAVGMLAPWDGRGPKPVPVYPPQVAP